MGVGDRKKKNKKKIFFLKEKNQSISRGSSLGDTMGEIGV